ncbi:MAG: alpha/beta hydrolase family protein [Solirubrobacteraceae bacterium]
MSEDSSVFTPQVAQKERTLRHSHDMVEPRFRDIDFQHGLDTTLAACSQDMADEAEVIATAARIIDGDPDSWIDEWMGTAGSVWAAAAEAERNGYVLEACIAYRHASTYYAAALDRVFHSSEPERRPAIWRRQRDCWERALALGPTPVEHLRIPFGTGTLPGFFFPAPGADEGAARPLLIVNNGLDRPTSQTWAYAEDLASVCGCHWLTFDGPGQQALLYEQRVSCRPDWETVLSAVIDAVLMRPDVDPSRVAAIGISHGGYLLARALCFEYRLAAGVVDPGIVDLAAPWVERLPPLMTGQLDGGDRLASDREMRLTELFSPESAATLRMTSQAFGVDGRTHFDLFKLISGYRLGNELSSMTTPLLIVDDGDTGPWPGQSRLLNKRLPTTSTLAHPAAPGHSGALRSCLPRSDRRITDWLIERLAVPDKQGG